MRLAVIAIVLYLVACSSAAQSTPTSPPASETGLEETGLQEGEVIALVQEYLDAKTRTTSFIDSPDVVVSCLEHVLGWDPVWQAAQIDSAVWLITLDGSFSVTGSSRIIPVHKEWNLSLPSREIRTIQGDC